jgi:hypothetical protein
VRWHACHEQVELACVVALEFDVHGVSSKKTQPGEPLYHRGAGLDPARRQGG